MQTYLIVVRLGEEKRYLKLINDINDAVTVQFVNKENASLFSGNQVELYIPLFREQQHVLLNTQTVYWNHNLDIFAETFGEVTL